MFAFQAPSCSWMQVASRYHCGWFWARQFFGRVHELVLLAAAKLVVMVNNTTITTSRATRISLPPYWLHAAPATLGQKRTESLSLVVKVDAAYNRFRSNPSLRSTFSHRPLGSREFGDDGDNACAWAACEDGERGPLASGDVSRIRGLRGRRDLHPRSVALGDADELAPHTPLPRDDQPHSRCAALRKTS